MIMANSEDPDLMPFSMASDLGLHSLWQRLCPIIWVITCTIVISILIIKTKTVALFIPTLVSFFSSCVSPIHDQELEM